MKNEAADWVAVERVKSGQPVGRALYASEWLLLLTWAARAGIGNAELASRIIRPDGKRLTAHAVEQRRRRLRDRLPEDARLVKKEDLWWRRVCGCYRKAA